jgi:hypothetical protein
MEGDEEASVSVEYYLTFVLLIISGCPGKQSKGLMISS